VYYHYQIICKHNHVCVTVPLELNANQYYVKALCLFPCFLLESNPQGKHREQKTQALVFIPSSTLSFGVEITT
jgi:hypothetical protein